MIIKYFTNKIEKLQDLKNEYKQLAKKHHPDLGGNVEIMKIINNEYEYLKENLHTGHTSIPADIENFTEVINELIKYNIDIELIGNWIWVGGDTKPVKDKLKELGFYWASKKKLWYLKPAGAISKSRGNKSIDEIRAVYGSQTIKTKHNPKPIQ